MKLQHPKMHLGIPRSGVKGWQVAGMCGRHYAVLVSHSVVGVGEGETAIKALAFAIQDARVKRGLKGSHLPYTLAQRLLDSAIHSPPV